MRGSGRPSSSRFGALAQGQHGLVQHQQQQHPQQQLQQVPPPLDSNQQVETNPITPTPEMENTAAARLTTSTIVLGNQPQYQYPSGHEQFGLPPSRTSAAGGMFSAANYSTGGLPPPAVPQPRNISFLYHPQDDPKTAPRILPTNTAPPPGQQLPVRSVQQQSIAKVVPEPGQGEIAGQIFVQDGRVRPPLAANLPLPPGGKLVSILKKRKRVHFGPVTEILIPVKDELERLSFVDHPQAANGSSSHQVRVAPVTSSTGFSLEEEEGSNSTQDSEIVDQLEPGAAPPPFMNNPASAPQAAPDAATGRGDSTSTTDDVLTPRDEAQEEADAIPPIQNGKGDLAAFTVEEEPDLIAPSSATKGSRKSSSSLSTSLEGVDRQLPSGVAFHTRSGQQELAMSLNPITTNDGSSRLDLGYDQKVSAEEQALLISNTGSATLLGGGVVDGTINKSNSSQSYDNLFDSYFKTTFGIMKVGAADPSTGGEGDDAPPTASKNSTVSNQQQQQSSGGTNTTQGGGSLSFCSLPLRQPSPPVAPSQQEKPLEVTATQTVVDIPKEVGDSNQGVQNNLPPESPSFVLPPRQLFDAQTSQQLTANNASTTSLQEQQPQESQLVDSSTVGANEVAAQAESERGNDLLMALNGALNLPQNLVATSIISGQGVETPSGNRGKEPPSDATTGAPPGLLLPSSGDAAALLLASTTNKPSQRSLTSGTPTSSQLLDDGEKPRAQPQIHNHNEEKHGESVNQNPTCRGKRGRQTAEEEVQQQTKEKKSNPTPRYRCVLCGRADDVRPAVFKDRKRQWELQHGIEVNTNPADDQRTPAGAILDANGDSTGRKSGGSGTSSVSPSRASRLELFLREEAPEEAVPGMFTICPRPKERGGDICVHLHCALWSPNCFFDDKNQLVGVEKEVNRSKDIKCAICGKPGASVGCHNSSCERSYHFPCALAASMSEGKAVKLYHSKMLVACKKHAGRSLSGEKRKIEGRSSTGSHICEEERK